MQQAEEVLLFQRLTFIPRPNNSESTSQCRTGLHKQAMVYIQKKCRNSKEPIFYIHNYIQKNHDTNATTAHRRYLCTSSFEVQNQVELRVL
jgi:hypothetical protein